MPNINSGYGQGSSFTNVSGPSGMDVSPYLNALLRQEQQFLQRRSQPVAPKRTMGLGAVTSRGGGVRQSGGPSEGANLGGAKASILRSQAAQAAAQAQAVAGAAPMTTHGYGFNMTPGHTIDNNALTGAQRAVFMPSGNGQIGGFPEPAPFDPSRSAIPGGGQLDFERELAALEAAKAARRGFERTR